MKFVKGVTVFVVLCLAAYGAFMLLKQPPKLDVSQSDISYLGDLGIDIQGGGQASDGGLSGVFGNVEGVAPISATPGPFASSSSAPPSFLVEPAAPFAAPFEPAPAQPVPNVSPDFSSPESVVLPPSNYSEPSDFSVPVAPLSEAPPIPITESPPPPLDNWDGPASIIPEMPPPAKLLQSPTPSPYPDIPSSANKEIIYQPIGRSVQEVPSDSEQAFSSADSVPLTAAPQSVPTYTRTAARQSLTFEPVKPEVQPNTPVVSFSPPKRIPPVQQSEQPRQSTIAPIPTASASAEMPSEQSAVQESVAQFIHSQRQLAESGIPENIRQAFIQLSQLYEHHQVGDQERAMMQPILDALALKVIYAKDIHILESPYRVKPGETIESIGKDFNLTPALLQKINGLVLSRELPAGTSLKVVYGQFDARISVKRKELTLLLGGLYAGRFPFSMPHTGTPASKGEFYVTNKTDRSILLNNGWILATPHARDATIVFADQDAKEIFDILSEQSVIVLE